MTFNVCRFLQPPQQSEYRTIPSPLTFSCAVRCIHTLLFLNPWQPLSQSVPVLLPFADCHINGIKWFVPFGDWLLSLSRCRLDSSMLFHTSIVCSFYYWIVFHCMDVTVCLSPHLLTFQALLLQFFSSLYYILSVLPDATHVTRFGIVPRLSLTF